MSEAITRGSRMHDLAVVDVDTAGDPRRSAGAGEVEIERGDAVHRQLRRQHRQRPQPRHAGDGHVEDVVGSPNATLPPNITGSPGAELDVVEAEHAVGDRHVAGRAWVIGTPAAVSEASSSTSVPVMPLTSARGEVEPERGRDPARRCS